MPETHDYDHLGHDHEGRDHGPGGLHHHAPPAGFDAAFAIGSALNAGFVVADVVFGLAAHSVALLADAVHNLGDVLGCCWHGSRMARAAAPDATPYLRLWAQLYSCLADECRGAAGGRRRHYR